MFKRFVLTLLSISTVMLLCSCGRGTETPVPPPDPPEDQEDGREFSTPYESGVYYDRLMDVEMTGVYSEDLLRVAFSQEGYHEGDTYDEMHGDSAGSGNRTEYGRFTGTNGQPWCASFISWCAWRADIPEDVIHPGINACADSLGVEFRSREDYEPKAGDLVIFDWLKDGLNSKKPESEYGDHIGIVYAVTETELYYIDGNSSDENDEDLNCVACHSRPLNDKNIKGYGVYADNAPDPIPEIPEFDQQEDELREFSTPYEVSVYYDRLMETELTGEYATDLLIVAFSQLGYHEGNSYVEMHGCSKGSGNYSEYGRVMGANGQPWCASFISWCAGRAGIPEDVITPSITACADSFGVEYHKRGEYVPKPGDIVIFDWVRNGLNDKEPEAEYGDHVGIVYRVTDKEMYYINGNGPDLKGRDTNCVKCLSRLLYDRNIKGYGVYSEEPADMSLIDVPPDI